MHKITVVLATYATTTTSYNTLCLDYCANVYTNSSDEVEAPLDQITFPHITLPVRTSESMGRSAQEDTTRSKVWVPAENTASVDPPRHIPEIEAGLRRSNCGAGGEGGKEGGRQ